MSDLRITQTRSTIGQSRRHRDTMRTLGLRKINASVVRPRTPELDGQLRLVAHLVRVDEAVASKE